MVEHSTADREVTSSNLVAPYVLSCSIILIPGSNLRNTQITARLIISSSKSDLIVKTSVLHPAQSTIFGCVTTRQQYVLHMRSLTTFHTGIIDPIFTCKLMYMLLRVGV